MTLFPDVVLEFSPTTDPFVEPVWEDITQHLRTFSITRGRSRELDRAEAGVAEFLLDDHLGYFDSTKLDGPYYPNIRPMRRIRIRAIPQTQESPFVVGSSFVGGPDVVGWFVIGIVLFSGFIETWSNNWTPQPSPTADATATIHAVDAFKIMAMQLGTTGISSYSGLVIAALLDYQGWPAGERNLEQGAYIVTTASDANTELLSALQQIDASEGGLFFVARDGKVTFYGAGHVRANPPLSGQVWGDLLTERQYQSISFATDEAIIWNYISVVSPYAAGGLFAFDISSARHYIRRPLELSTVLTSTADMQTRATEALARFSSPHQQITKLEVGVRDDLEWTDILSRDLLDRIVVRRRPLPGQLIEQDSVIQGITIDSSSRWKWSVVWTLTATPSVNLLTPNQASLETDASGWVAVTNCTVTRVTTTPDIGVGALLMTATANGNMSAATTPNTQIPVVVGRTYTALASLFAQLFLKSFHIEITWRNSGGSVISSSVGLTSTEVDGFYEPGVVTGVAPAGAAFATVLVVVHNADATTGHHVDSISFAEGTQTGWSPGTG